ncbi:hypothetical protein [Caballeronia sp. AZ1_KS37]|uniref:hypothetical protein n=1 Tax=Caballeronia sp. AZ1_KS37 TaxID=2921756 RepID=UPI0020285791|nr:hypothetical protein [Caballeronia sp. AZ1_KS37]
MEISLLLSNDSGSFQTILGQFIANESASAIASAAASAESAAESASSAAASFNSAASSQSSAAQSANSATAAGVSETNAGNSATASANSATAADASATGAANSALNAGSSASSASASASSAATSVTNAQNAATTAQNWASQATGTVDGVSFSAKYYSGVAQAAAASITLPIPTSSGGTGKTSHTANSILVGNGTSAVQNIGPGTNGQMLLGVTSGAPYWGNNPAISGATVDNTIIGGLTPAAGTFSSLNSNGAMSVNYSSATLSVNDSSGSGQAKVLLRANNASTWGLNSISTSKQFRLDRYVSGSFVDSPVTVDNTTGAVSLTNSLQVGGSATVSGVVNANSGVTFPDGYVQLIAPTGRNRIINGDCNVQQRAAALFSNAGTNNGYGACDRWRTVMTLTTGVIQAGYNNAFADPVTGAVKNWVYSQATTAITSISATGFLSGIHQIVEGLNSYDLLGQQVTVSFLFRSSVAGTYSVALKDGGNANSCVKTFSYPVALAIQRVVLTFATVPTSVAIPKSTAAGLQLFIGALGTAVTTSTLDTWQAGANIVATGSVNWGVSTNNAIWATDIQVEAGPAATYFEKKLFVEQYLACERYYQIIPILKFWGYGNAGGQIGQTQSLPVPMRATPTAVLSAVSYGNANGYTLESINNQVITAYANITATGGGSAAATITLNAEL